MPNCFPLKSVLLSMKNIRGFSDSLDKQGRNQDFKNAKVTSLHDAPLSFSVFYSFN